MLDEKVVDLDHCQNIVELGVKHRVYDGDFLMAIHDLVDHKGPTDVLSNDLVKAVQYFVNSVKHNVTGSNAMGKVQRDYNISASLQILTLVATSMVGLDYAKHIGPHFVEDVRVKMELLNG